MILIIIPVMKLSTKLNNRIANTHDMCYNDTSASRKRQHSSISQQVHIINTTRGIITRTITDADNNHLNKKGNATTITVPPLFSGYVWQLTTSYVFCSGCEPVISLPARLSETRCYRNGNGEQPRQNKHIK